MGTDIFTEACNPARVDYGNELAQRHRARLTAARMARDREDLVQMLDVLGLMPSRDPGSGH